LFVTCTFTILVRRKEKKEGRKKKEDEERLLRVSVPGAAHSSLEHPDNHKTQNTLSNITMKGTYNT